jgi:hypothetical protein
LDSSLFGVTPIEQVRPVARRTLLRISWASARTPRGRRRVLRAGHGAQVDVDLVDAAVLDHRRDLGARRP